MTALELYKFVTKNNCEMHWVKDKTELICLINFIYLAEFTEMIGYVEGGYDVCLMNDYVGVVLNDLCEWNEIDPEEIYSKKND